MKMAVIKGTAGKIKVGSAVIAEVRSFSVNERVNTVETTTLGSTSESHATTYTSFSGTIDAFFDDTDTSGQGACTAGASVTLNLLPEGDATGAVMLTGTATIEQRDITQSFDGLAEMTLTFRGDGALTTTTAP